MTIKIDKKLCPPCSEEWMRWLDYSEPPPLKIAQSGPDRGQVRYGKRIIQTIRAQQQSIKQNCERSHSA